MEKMSKVRKILDKLELTQTVQEVDPDTSNFMLLTDDEIAMVLAQRAKRLRIESNKRQSDLASKADMPISTYSLFEREGKTSLSSFVAIVRALGRINELEEILSSTVSDRIKKMEKKSSEKPVKRVRLENKD
jgi:DNA-binding XRE family transcriptional regulator